MLGQQLFTATVLSLLLYGGGGSGCRGGQNTGPRGDEPIPAVENQPAAELKVLAGGFHSAITRPFIAVVRNTETYAALAKLDAGFPQLDEEFFKSNVAVVAFLGERPTGGYSVEITRIENGQIQIDEKVPAKGAMVAQVITSPFKLASVPAKGTRPVSLILHGPWRQSLRPYGLTSGSFTISGGFAGIVKQFGLEGQVSVIRQNGLVTFAFEIFSHELTERRSLTGFETGVIRSQGDMAILRMTAGSLISPPNSGLKASAVFSAADDTLELKFFALPSMIADGYSGRGDFEAKIIGPPPKP